MAKPKLRFPEFTDDWEQRKLSEFVEFFSGLTYTPNDVQENGTLVLRSSNVSNGEVVDADNVYVNPQVVNSENVKVGDIVVVVRNGSRSLIGKHAQIKAFMPNTVIGAFMTGIRSECPEFTNALLNTSRFEEEITMNMGATINQITGYMFSKMEFKVPCLDEQKKIGEYFENLDNLITLQRREVETLEKQKKAVMQKIFSQQIRFKKDDGTDYPEWEVAKLKNILTEYHEKCEKDGTYEHISLTTEGVVPKSERYERDQLVTHEDKKYRVTHIDDICYNPANLKFGVIARNKYKDGIFSPIYVTFRVNNGYLPEFVEALVTRRDFIQFALKFQQGTVFERMSVSSADLLEISIKAPCLEEQQKIADLLSEMDNAIDLAKQELEKWKLLKKGLLQQMFV